MTTTQTNKVQVRMPDGQIVAVAQGTPKADIIAKYERVKAMQQPEGKGLIGTAVDAAQGVGEVLLSGATGMASTAAGAITGAAQYAGTAGKEDGLKTMEQIQHAGTFEPRSDAGKWAMGKLEAGINEMRRRGQIVGDMVYDATESPFLAAAANTLTGGSVDVLLGSLGLRTGVRARGKVAERAATKAKVEAELKAKSDAEAKAVVEYEPTTVEAPRPGVNRDSRPPGSDIPPVVENPVPQAVAAKPAPGLTLEPQAKAPLRNDFTDPVAMQDVVARNVKDAQMEQGFRELGLQNLQKKYPGRQSGQVTPGVFVEGIVNIFKKARGDKSKFRRQVVAEFGEGMDPYAAALFRQAGQGAEAILQSGAAKAAVSKSIEVGQQTVDALKTTAQVDRPGGFAQNTVGATPETSQIADMLIQPKRTVTWDETIAAAEKLGLNSFSQVKRLRNMTEDMHVKVVAAGDVAAGEINTIKAIADRIKQSGGSQEDLWVLGEHMLKLGSVVDDVARVSSNTGRTLNALKMLKDQGRQSDAIMKIFDTFKGEGNMRLMADAISQLDDAGIAKMARLAPTWTGAAAELYINALLTSTLTHVRNTVGNTMYMGYSVPQTYLAAAFGKLPWWNKKGNAISFREANAYAGGLAMGLKDATMASWKTIVSGEPQVKSFGRTMIDEATKIEAQAHRQFTSELLPNRLQGTAFAKVWDAVGEYGIRAPGRALLAEDAFFKSMLYSGELSRLAIKEARNAVKDGKITKAEFNDFLTEVKTNPSRAMHDTAMDWAHKMTFTRELGSFGQKIQTLANHHPSARFVAPFIRTPINLVKESVSGTPVALLDKGLRSSIKAGGAEGNRALAHMVMGSGIAYMVFELAKDGKFIGSAPKHPDASKVFRDKWGGVENGIVMEDGTAVSLNGIGVFDTITGLAADAVAIMDYMSDDQWNEVASLVATSLTNNLLDKTFTQGLFDLVTAATDFERYGYRLFDYANTLTMPRIVAQAARNDDPTIRSPRGYAPEDIKLGEDPNLDMARRIIDQVKRDVPGYREDLPPDYDLVGRVKLGHVSWVNPFIPANAQDNPVINELYDLKHTVQVPRDVLMGTPLDKYQHADYKKATGYYFDQFAQRMISNPKWATLPPEIRKQELTKVHKKAKEAAVAPMLGKYPELKLRIPAMKQKEARDLLSNEKSKYFK